MDNGVRDIGRGSRPVSFQLIIYAFRPDEMLALSFLSNFCPLLTQWLPSCDILPWQLLFLRPLVMLLENFPLRLWVMESLFRQSQPKHPRWNW